MNPAHAIKRQRQLCAGCTAEFATTRKGQRFCSPICANLKRNAKLSNLPEIKSRWRRKDRLIFVVETVFTADIGTRIRARVEFSRHYREYTPETWRKEFVRI